VTVANQGNYISFGAQFSELLDYASPMIYNFFLTEKNAKYSKKQHH
jgi:hypothetical protein